MPHVHIKLAKEEITTEQKQEVIKQVTNVLADVLGKNPKVTSVVIEEIDPDNYGFGGITVSEIRSSKS
jgi:4-oxalocrotonate tautomerase